MSDLSPLCASKRMSANGRVYEPSPTRTASWQLSMRGFEGLNSSCGRFAPNQSHCAVSSVKFVRRAVFRERATARRTYDAEAYGEVVWS
jgi:hypothetical protein